MLRRARPSEPLLPANFEPWGDHAGLLNSSPKIVLWSLPLAFITITPLLLLGTLEKAIIVPSGDQVGE